VTRVREGPPAFEILNEVRDSQADLVALGARGHSELVTGGLGAVARTVLLQTSASVLIAPTAGSPGRWSWGSHA